MQYGYFLNGEIAAPVSMCTRFNDIGAWHTLSDEERAKHGWYPCHIIDENKDSRLFNRLPPVKTFNEGVITLEYSYLPKSIYDVIEERLSVLKAAHTAALQAPLVLFEALYSVSDIPAIEAAINRSNEELVYVCQPTVKLLKKEDAKSILSSLYQREHDLLQERYLAQEGLKNALTPEAVLLIDLSSGFNKYLE